jgi:glycine/D-amino acid oxidase-like deaminating enzyme
VLELEPDLRLAPAVEEVAFYPDEGYAWPRPLIAQLIALAQAHGATTRWNARVTGLDGAVAYLDSGERIEADAIVLCCGRWSAEVAALSGFELPMVDDSAGSLAVGLLVLTAPAVQRLRRLVVADDLMFRPDGSGRLLLHSDAHDRRVSPRQPAKAVATVAAEVVDAVFEHLDVPTVPEIEKTTIGIRALTADYLPAVGWLPGAGVYLCVTHSGITLAPVLGELVAAEILAGAEERLLAAFRPDRFATRRGAPANSVGQEVSR